jgi:CheY-like chemotaxis protein
MARILVADDNSDLRNMLAAMLELDGHEVMALDNGFAVLDEVKRRLPDAVVLDIGLPSLDGIQVARRLRQQYGYSLRLIAYSGFDDPSTRRKIMQANFDAVFSKPAPVAMLLDAVGEAYLRRRDHLSDRRTERRSRLSS